MYKLLLTLALVIVCEASNCGTPCRNNPCPTPCRQGGGGRISPWPVMQTGSQQFDGVPDMQMPINMPMPSQQMPNIGTPGMQGTPWTGSSNGMGMGSMPMYSGMQGAPDMQMSGYSGLGQTSSFSNMQPISSMSNIPGYQGMESMPGYSGMQSTSGINNMQLPGYQGMESMPGYSGMQATSGMNNMQLPGYQGMESMPGYSGMQGFPGMNNMPMSGYQGGMGSLPSYSGMPGMNNLQTSGFPMMGSVPNYSGSLAGAASVANGNGVSGGYIYSGAPGQTPKVQYYGNVMPNHPSMNNIESMGRQEAVFPYGMNQ